MNELIEHIKKQLEYRAEIMGLYISRIEHFENDNFIYVICNVLPSGNPLNTTAGIDNDIMMTRRKLHIFTAGLYARINIDTKEIIYGDNHNPLEGSLSQLIGIP